MTVTGGSALGREDIDRMVKEAEAHAEEDHQRRLAVEMRNEADALAFRTEKLLADNAEALGEDIKAPVVEALEKLKEALKTDDNDAVKAAMDDLNTKASTMGQAMYAAAQASQQAEAGQASDEGAPAADDDVVDAEIVDEDGKEAK
jgi:molecular chaperone DnaK